LTVVFIGVEAANSFVKAATEHEELCYLNTLRRVEPFEDTTGLTVFSFEEIAYIVGEVTGVSSSARNDDRYASEGYRAETIIAVAQLVENGAEVILSTGLPAEDHKNKLNHTKAQRNLKGEHTIYINGEERTFNIKKVYTPLQPVGSVVNRLYGFDRKLRKGSEEERKARKLVIDIGFGTTDVVDIEGLRTIRYDGISVGMLEANKIVKDELTKKGARGIQSYLHMDALIRNADVLSEKDEFTKSDVIRRVTINVGGKEYEIGKSVHEAQAYTTRLIMQRVENLGYVLKDYDIVLFTGGSTLALREYLKPYLEGVNTKAEKGAQIANTKGYAKYAMIQEAKARL
jgi:plasmid segregation protein ParM